MNSTPSNKCCLFGGVGRGAGKWSGVQHFCVFGLKCSNEPQSKQPQNSCARVFALTLCFRLLFTRTPLGWATTSTDSNNILCCSLLGAVFLLFFCSLSLQYVCLAACLLLLLGLYAAATVGVAATAVALVVVVVCSLGQLDRTIQ